MRWTGFRRYAPSGRLCDSATCCCLKTSAVTGFRITSVNISTALCNKATFVMIRRHVINRSGTRHKQERNSLIYIDIIKTLKYCKTRNVHVEDIFASFMVDQKTQIYHPANLFPSTRPTLPWVKNRKTQNLTDMNISCFTVYFPLF